MNKYTTFILLMLVAAASSYIGWVSAKLGNNADRVKVTEREKALQIVVEGYVPTCEQLTKVGVYGPINNGNNHLLVNVKSQYFHVLGYNTDPGTSPVSWWYGAGREELRAQVCKKP